MIAAGFVFWGLFAIFGVIVIAYLLWMRAADARDPHFTPRQPEDEEDAP